MLVIWSLGMSIWRGAARSSHILLSTGPGVDDSCHQPVLVASDIEDHTVADEADTGKVPLHVSPRVPRHGLVADMRVPRPQWPFSILMAGSLPELFQTSLGNHPHLHALP